MSRPFTIEPKNPAAIRIAGLTTMTYLQAKDALHEFNAEQIIELARMAVIAGIDPSDFICYCSALKTASRRH